jgi:hypothetical protein
MIVDFELEEWIRSPVIRRQGDDYARITTSEFRDAPAAITERQGVFYRNLIRMAVALRAQDIPADFTHPVRGELYLDRGCIKIAEHAGFIEPLRDNEVGVVDSIRLAWRC